MNGKSLLFRAVCLAVTAFLFSLFGPAAQAQVTSSAITGRVADGKGEVLPGATVVAIHEPSGTKYGSVTNEQGLYTIPAVRVGGPYKVTVSFVGFNEQSQENIFANLGTAANVNFELKDGSTDLAEVIVTGAGSDIFSSDRTGAATTFNKGLISSLPYTRPYTERHYQIQCVQQWPLFRRAGQPLQQLHHRRFRVQQRFRSW